MNFRRQAQEEGSLIPMVPMLAAALLLLGVLAGGLAFSPAATDRAADEVILELPVVSAGAPLNRAPGEVLIQLATNGVLYWNREVVTADEWRERLSRFDQDGGSNAAVLVRADRGVAFERVADLLEACRRAGIDRCRVAARAEDVRE
jgi:biopolymer transport protein ExbD